MEEQLQPLYKDEEDYHRRHHSTTKRTQSVLMVLLAANIILCALNITFLLRDKRVECLAPLSSARHDELHKERWNLVLGENSPYTASQSAEVDALWDEISAGGPVGGFKVQQDELDAINKSSIPLPDDSGFVGLADVFHQLHCLNYLRKVIYNETYQMGFRDDPVPHAHIPHCIDSIRLSLQCSADTSLITFHWLEGWPWPWPDFSGVHQCRNWEAIKASTRLDDVGALSHPVFGSDPKVWQEHWDVSKLPLRSEDVKIIQR